MKQSDIAINNVLARFKRLNQREREIVVACSGGVDSMALLFCASKLKNTKIKCLHVTHDIRPKEETDEDLKAVQRLCKRLEVEFIHHSCEPQKQWQEEGGNLEEIASIKRHQSFEAACAVREGMSVVYGTRCVATAHHADDQLETILMKIGRGCGLRGLSGIASYYHESGMILIRPMLGITKEDCRAICVDNGIVWNDDSTNDNYYLTRNKIRSKVLPLLKEMFPEIAQNSTDAAEVCASAQEVVGHSLLDNLYRHQIEMCASSRRSIRVEALRLAEDIEIYEWLVRETRGIGGDPAKINKFMLDQIVNAIRDKKTKTFNWVSSNAIKGSVIELNQDTLTIRHRRDSDGTEA